MKKTRKYLLEAAQEYYDELHNKFPVVEIDEVMPDSYAGADLWIALEAPGDMVTEVLEAAVKLNSKWSDQRHLSILVTVRSKSGPIPV